LISRSGAIEAFNNNYKSGMLSSIQKGVKSIRPDSSGFFLLPVDITAIRPLTIASMIKEFKKLKNQIIVPFFNDISGHPPLIPMSFKKDIFELKDGLTLRDVIFSKKVKSISLKVHDQGILMDADNIKGYAKILKKYRNLSIPDKEECLSIVNELLPENDTIRSHMADVAYTALKIANASKNKLNIELIIAASLLHDIKRKEKDHAIAGADLIDKLGFQEVSKIIAQHMDIDLNPETNLNEKEIVYFADKVCNGQGIDLNYHKRFENSVVKSPWAITSITKRYENTQIIQTRIEKSAGKPIKEILTA
ncbi:MAG: HD domain-containing protein, partial [Desulfobacteraceae bacterium]|nr:HD domain-containing protein [Desulfobacteraceae bacterium]